MSLPSSPPPVRNPAGATTDPPYGPLADSGNSNPFYYHQFSDDFDYSLGPTGLWTVSKGSSGTAVHIAGDGGLAQLATAATLNDYVALQMPAADFTLPQGAGAGKKAFFLARLQLSDVNLSGFILGLCNTIANVFTGTTDGLYFQKASGSTVINLVSMIGSVATTTAIPAAAYTLTNAVNIDLGWYVDRNGNVNAFCSPNMVGYVPQSGTGASLPTRGRVLQVAGLTLTTAILNPTIGVLAGAAAVKSLTTDFVCVQKER